MPRALVSCLVLSVLAAPACVISDHHTFVEHDEKKFPANELVELHLTTFDGSIEVRTWDKPEISVDVEKRARDKDAVGKIQVVTEQTGNRISVEARHPSGTQVVFIGMNTSPSARMVATVPRETNLVLRTTDGAVFVDRVKGKLTVRTQDGTIKAVETSGELLAESGDGSIYLEEVTGSVEARTDDGTVRVSGTPSALRVRSGDGAIVLRIRKGAVMAADWLVVTRDGSISAELPDEFNADIEADPGSDGRTRSEFTLVNSSGGTRADRKLSGRIGTGGHIFRLQTGDGTIRLSRY